MHRRIGTLAQRSRATTEAQQLKGRLHLDRSLAEGDTWMPSPPSMPPHAASPMTPSRRHHGHSPARRPVQRPAGSPAMNRHHLASDLHVPAAYAEGQTWTRDLRGSRVRCYSPRIPHDKVTTWQSIRISPCQGVIIG